MQTFDSASWPIAGWVLLSPRVWNMRHGFNWDRFNSLETLWLQSLLQNGQAALLCSRHVGSNLLLVELSTSAQVSLACRHFVQKHLVVQSGAPMLKISFRWYVFQMSCSRSFVQRAHISESTALYQSSDMWAGAGFLILPANHLNKWSRAHRV